MPLHETGARQAGGHGQVCSGCYRGRICRALAARLEASRHAVDRPHHRLRDLSRFALMMIAQQPTRQPTSATEAPRRDATYIDANGTAHITRVVPVPQDLSPEARNSSVRSCPMRPLLSHSPRGAATWRTGQSARIGSGVSSAQTRSRTPRLAEFQCWLSSFQTRSRNSETC